MIWTQAIDWKITLLALLALAIIAVLGWLWNRYTDWRLQPDAFARWHIGHAAIAVSLYGLLNIGLLQLFHSTTFLRFFFGDNFSDKFFDLLYPLNSSLRLSIPSLAALLVVAWRWPGWRAWGSGRWQPSTMLLLGLGAVLLNNSLFWLFHKGLQPASGSGNITMLLSIQEAFGTPFFLLLVVLLIPIGEEWLFRGVLLSALERQLPFSIANFLQALAFAAIHQSLLYLPFFVGFGLLSGYLRKQSCGMGSSLVMHAFNNLAYSIRFL